MPIEQAVKFWQSPLPPTRLAVPAPGWHSLSPRLATSRRCAADIASPLLPLPHWIIVSQLDLLANHSSTPFRLHALAQYQSGKELATAGCLLHLGQTLAQGGRLMAEIPVMVQIVHEQR